MDIENALSQLHQIIKDNPQIDSSKPSQYDELSQQKMIKNNPRKSRYHFEKSNPDRINNKSLKAQVLQKMNNMSHVQEKVEIKIPVLKSSRLQNVNSQQKNMFFESMLSGEASQNIQNINFIGKEQQPFEQKIIKNLNKTYFKTTYNVNAKSNKMMNSLRIKKSSMSNYNVQWSQKDFQEAKFQWRQIGYIPNKFFPTRKASNSKNRIYTPKKSQQEGVYKQSNDFNITFSGTLLRDKWANKHRITHNGSMTSRFDDLERSRHLNSSKLLNKSQQFMNKEHVQRFLAKPTESSSRPVSENRKRLSTGIQLMKNRKISQHLIGNLPLKRYFQSQNKSILNFARSTRIPKNKCTSEKNDLQQQNSECIIGKKMIIRY